MRNPQSNLPLYIIYKYFFAYVIVMIVVVRLKELALYGEHLGSAQESRVLLIFVGVFSVLQVLASRFIFMATVSKEAIILSHGPTIRWDNIEFVSRWHHLYVLKTKDQKRFYAFPAERAVIKILGDHVEYTDMDQIINLRKPNT